MKFIRKRSVWTILTSYMCIWLVISIVAGMIMNSYKTLINTSLGLSGYRIESVGDTNEDLEYFKSDYVQRDADGNVLYTTDANGYVHQVYDDVALRAAALEKANQVQREGTTILWNSEQNGLPLAKGDKVSLFSHSTVDWVYSGRSSGRAWVDGASDMKKALTDAGLSVNTTLWDFYKSGAGKDYERTLKLKINEVPWNKYTDNVKNSFSSYGDAAIIVLSRQGGEGYNDSLYDNTATLADTPSGDYYDLSTQERDMIEEVIAAKKAGTFSKVIVLLNTPTDLWFAPLFEYKTEIDSCVWVGQTGYQGLNEVGKILVGDSIPSGHLVDTFLYNTRSNPAFINSVAMAYTNAGSMHLDNMLQQGTYLVYAEGIYVGYKYYETRYEDAVLGRGNAGSTAGAVNSKAQWSYAEEVAFPFGYGGSYTTFEYSKYEVKQNADGDYDVTLTVKNTGKAAGADAVQIYIQRPYTEYDKQWGIEQAAVNLVGYAKTNELAPGESVDVTITVRADAFRTYDAYNKKTYIREKTNGIDAYYITAAQDAHDAVNNILAAKGKTPENTNGIMDAQGNKALVHKVEFDSDDFETYSISEATGNPITNQFDDTDWNLYENKTDTKVTYLSRNDWQSTYPLEAIKLALNDAMVKGLAWKNEVEANPADEMPLYGQSHVFNLVDMKGLEYDNAAWETLLNQLTFDEQVQLLGIAYHGTKPITSIAKPAEVTKDGPLGVRQPYQTNSDEYTLSYPSTTILAATYNDQLALEVGELMGEDMLHAGVTGLYGTGAGIHRTSYGSRNFEYYSEDGFISGMMTKWQTIGVQSKGCYVNVKHVALNDQETNRLGIGIWANEQAIREIYLAPYEYAVLEADCTGLMSSFNRFGVTWSGAHKGLLTNVVRDEWGFEGFVITDFLSGDYMRDINGVMAGNDCILHSDTDLTEFKKGEDNATIAKAMRESAHRILYVVANSNAMNGLSSSTRTYEVQEWWQKLIVVVQIGLAVITAALLAITIFAFVYHKKNKGNSNCDDSSANEQSAKQNHTAKNVVAIILAAVIVLISVILPIVLHSLPNDFITEMNSANSADEDPSNPSSVTDKLEGDLTTYKFEAEVAEIVASSSKTAAGVSGSLADSNHPSGDSYVHHLDSSDSLTVTFKITSSEANKALLSICMGRREKSQKLADMWTITVNGTVYAYDSNLEFSEYDSGSVKYYDWKELEVGVIDLQAGNNVIEFKNVNKVLLNFDYIALTSAAALQDTREVQNGHTYDWEVVTEPTATGTGSIGGYCKTCRHYATEELPVISEANGYTKIASSAVDGSAFSRSQWSYTKDGKTFVFSSGSYPESAQSYLFEAENAILGGAAQSSIANVVLAASGNAYVGKLNDNDASITLNVESDRDCEALLIVNFGCRTKKDFQFNSGRTLTVNGAEVTVSDDVVFTKNSNGADWYGWKEFEVAVITLKSGGNTITLSNKKGESFSNIDYFKLVCDGTLTSSMSSSGDDQGGSEVTGGNQYTFTVADNDPFDAANNGSAKGGAVNKYTNKRGTAYQQTQGATFTSTITASGAGEAQLIIKVVGKGENSITEIFKLLKVNNSEVTINSGTAKLKGWNVDDAADVIVATISLKKGTNVISFTMGELNVNIAGIELISTVSIA